jgi:heme-degrading monooxygenase HmoA
MTFRPEAVPAFLDIFAASQPKIEAQPGCHSVRLWRDSAAPHILATYSIWESEAALNHYRRSELFGSVWPRTKVLFAEPAQTFSFEEYTTDGV